MRLRNALVVWTLMVSGALLFSSSQAWGQATWSEIPQSPKSTDWAIPSLEESEVVELEEWGVEPLQMTSPGMASLPGQSRVVAQEGEGADSNGAATDLPTAPKLGISVTGAWVSRYMFKGFKILDSGVYLHDVDLDLWSTGLHFKFQGAYPAHDRSKSLIAGRVPPPLEDIIDQLGITFDREDIDAFTYNLSWRGAICDGMNVELGGNYYDFFRLDSGKGDFWESYGVLTLSNLPLTPHFGAYYAWPYNDEKKGEGWMTDIGVTKPVPIPACAALGTPATALLLSADLWYNGGAWSGRVDPGWAYAEFKAMAPIPLPCNLLLIPGVTYQVSLEDTVDEDDELYASVAVQYKW